MLGAGKSAGVGSRIRRKKITKKKKVYLNGLDLLGFSIKMRALRDANVVVTNYLKKL